MRRFRTRWKHERIMALGLAALAAGSVAIRSAAGHGAVIRLGAPAVVAGDSLAVTGEGLGEGAEITLALEGAIGTTALVTLRGDAHGRFETRVAIPADTPPGTYRVVATAGEDRATVDLVVTSSPMAADPAASHGLHSTGEATAAEVDLDRRRSPLGTGLAWGGVGLLVALGVYLVRRPRES